MIPATIEATVPMTQLLGDDDEDMDDGKNWGLLQCLQNTQVHRLIKSEYVIGRRDHCDIIHQQPTISGRHCKIFVKDDERGRQVWLEDMSTNGTWVDGKLIQKSKRLLTENDEIVLCPKTEKHPKISYTISIRPLEDGSSSKDAFAQKYHVVRHLGSGAFAEVKLAVNRGTGERVAVKVIDKTKFVAKSMNSGNKLMDEVQIMQKLNHPSIVKVYEVIEDTDKLYIMLELVDGGDLFDYICKCQRIEEDEARNLFGQMLEGVEYLHQRKIVHRDLKPENMLLSTSKTVKITDFGLSRLVGESSFMQTLCVPEEHEILTNQGFMDLSAYLECQRDHTSGAETLVASYNPVSKHMTFEKPIRVVHHARATRQMVEFSSESCGVNMMATRDHRMFAKCGEESSFRTVPARTFVDSDDPGYSRMCQVTAAECGVECTNATEPPFTVAANTSFDQMYEMYGAWLVSAASTNGGGGNEELRVFFEEYQRDTFASWVWSQNANALQSIIRGMLDRNRCVSTPSVAFRDEIVQVCAMAGYSALFRWQCGQWHITVEDATCTPVLYKKSGEILPCEYTGRVWCFQMPSGFVWVRSVRKNASGVVMEASRCVLTRNCGTPQYLAPELVAMTESAHADGYKKEVDIWSLGCILFVMLSGRYPFEDEELRKLYRQIATCNVSFSDDAWLTISEEVKDLIKCMLRVDPKERISVEAIYEHPWMKNGAPRTMDIDEPVAESTKRSLDDRPIDEEEPMSTKRRKANEEPLL